MKKNLINAERLKDVAANGYYDLEIDSWEKVIQK